MAKLNAYSPVSGRGIHLAVDDSDLAGYFGKGNQFVPVKGDVRVLMVLQDSVSHYKGRLHEGNGAIYERMNTISCDGALAIQPSSDSGPMEITTLHLTPSALTEFHRRVVRNTEAYRL